MAPVRCRSVLFRSTAGGRFASRSSVDFTHPMKPALGVMVRREESPESLVSLVRHFEALGFEDAWLVEDMGFGGGIATAVQALSSTRTINVGIGILPAVVRNPVFLAMELASVARLHPRRFMPAIGHGVSSWMEDVGATVASPLTALEETITVVRRLLSGETVDFSGRYVAVRDAQLEFPPEQIPLMLAGVRGPKSLSLAARYFDGALLAEPAGPGYARWARETMLNAESRRVRPTLAVYNWFAVDKDGDAARDRLRMALAINLEDPSTRIHLMGLPFANEVTDIASSDASRESRAASLEDGWIRSLTISGTPAECATSIRSLSQAGVDRIVLVPVPGRAAVEAEAFAHQVRPLLG